LTGVAATLEAAFKVTLQPYNHKTGSYRGHDHAVHVPAALHEIV
jgi:hypothetical protein